MGYFHISNLTYVNVESFAVEDPIISMGGGPNGAAPTSNDGKDRGTNLQYYDVVFINKAYSHII